MTHLYENLNQPEGKWLRDCLLLMTVFGIFFFTGLGSAPLIDPDEGRYAEIPREMLEKGNFITPTLNYVKYFEKPPLLYWVNAGSMYLFGKNEMAARLPTAMAGLITIVLTYSAGRSLFNRRTGLLSAMILGSCAGFLMQGRIILTDMLLTCCFTAALFAFLVASQKETVRKNLWYNLFFLFCGLAVLTKGLIGIVLPAGIVFWFMLLGNRWRLLSQIPWFTGLTVFFGVTAPWFLLVSQHNPEFPHFFFIREHFQRYTSTIHQRHQPFWFFLPILLLTMLPWSFFIPDSLTDAWRNRHKTGNTTLFLFVWPLVFIFFFSVSSSKLIPYILPVFPPLAILIACRLGNGWLQRHSPLKTGVLLLGLILLVCGIAISLLPFLADLKPYFMKSGQLARQLASLLYDPEPVLTSGIMIGIGLAFTLPGVILLAARKSDSTRLMAGLLCLFGLMLNLIIPWLFAKFAAPRLSARTLAAAAQLNMKADTKLVQFGPRQGMNFYTGKRLITAGDADELTFGSTAGDHRDWFITIEQFVQLWKSEQHLLVVISPHQAGRLQLMSAQTRILADNGTLQLISNR